MKHLRPIAAAAVCAAIVLAVSAFGASREATQKSHLTLIERPISIFVQDNGPKGPSVGVHVAAPGVVVPKRGVIRAVIGGTGKYLGARSQVVQTPLSNGNIKNVLTLLVP